MRIHLAPALALALATVLAPVAHAGGGPERTVVVVNADSPVSLWVAHEYARRRAIPASHLIYLDGVPTLRVVDLATYRERLWNPVKATLVERGLLETTHLLAWSADFPFAVDVAEEAKVKKVESLQNVPLRAALTGLTYLWRHVEAQDPARYLDLHGNRYFHGDETTRGAGASGRQLAPAEMALARSAQTALQKRDYAGARDAYTELVKLAPDLVGAWYDLACCHARLGETEAAFKALGQAVERGWADALHTLGDPDLEALRPLPEFEALLARMNKRPKSAHASHAFSAERLWNPDGSPRQGILASGELARDRYLLSVMLGYTGEWGNSAPEVLECLARGAASDGTQPDGTVYLLANDDVRADTRERFFPFTVGVLEGLGRKVRLLTKGEDGQDGIVPKGKNDVIGAVLGAAGLSWAGSDSTLLPGAIVEHLTSFGADFSHDGQTKLSELIRAGAAGSSGTAAEPLALWQKFPLPVIHAHYARGCSLAEAYYQSLAGPWQTLVVGDPLARPFARFAKVEFSPPAVSTALTGVVEVKPVVTPATSTQVGSLELWVDGRLVAEGAADAALAWDTTKEADGMHEVRVVAVEAGAIETRSHAIATLTVGNAGRSVTLVGPKAPTAWGAALVLTGKVEGATEVDLLHGARLLGTAPVKSGTFKLELDSLRLGPGSIPLVARARFAEGPAALSAAVTVGTEPPAHKPGKAKPSKPQPSKPQPSKPKGAKDGKDPKAAPVGAKTGLKLVVTDEKKKAHEGLLPALTDEALTKALTDLKVPQPKTLTLEGEIQVAADGFYQLVLTTTGAVTVQWAGQRALETPDAGPSRLAFAAAHLKAGWNAIRITLTPPSAPRLSALLSGAQVTAPLTPQFLRPAP